MDISVSKVLVRIESQKKPLFKISNLKISSGEKLLIKGASGKGKTTFLHLLSGLFKPNEGEVLIGDTHLSKLNEEERSLFRRQNIGMVFQKLNLIEHLTALENIELSLRDSKKIDRALQALSAVGLKGREKDRVSVLSLGEQQRVAIARVLASDCALVFADEPTSSLDDKNAFEVTELLMKACEGKTLIVVSHDQRIEKYFSTVKDFGDMTT